MKSYCPCFLKKQVVPISVELHMLPFGELPEEGKMCGLFIQDSAMAYTVEFRVAAPAEIFSEQLITQRLWSTSEDLNF